MELSFDPQRSDFMDRARGKTDTVSHWSFRDVDRAEARGTAGESTDGSTKMSCRRLLSQS